MGRKDKQMKQLNELREINFIFKRKEPKKYKTDTNLHIEIEERFLSKEFKEAVCKILTNFRDEIINWPRVNTVELAFVENLSGFSIVEAIMVKARRRQK